MPIFRPRTGWLSYLPLILVLFVSCFWSPTLHAQTAFDGKYRCVRIEVGRETQGCQSPPLILSGDGSGKCEQEKRLDLHSTLLYHEFGLSGSNHAEVRNKDPGA